MTVWRIKDILKMINKTVNKCGRCINGEIWVVSIEILVNKQIQSDDAAFVTVYRSDWW